MTRLDKLRAPLAAVMLWAVAAQARGQTLGQGASDDISLWRVLGALVLCLGLAVGAAYALRGRLRGGALPAFGTSDRRLRLVESVRLSHQTDICLMRRDGEEFLVAATAQGLVVIAPPAASGGSEAS